MTVSEDGFVEIPRIRSEKCNFLTMGFFLVLLRPTPTPPLALSCLLVYSLLSPSLPLSSFPFSLSLSLDVCFVQRGRETQLGGLALQQEFLVWSESLVVRSQNYSYIVRPLAKLAIETYLYASSMNDRGE